MQAAFSKFDERLLTDKLPFNFIFIGFVKLFLPQAKIMTISLSEQKSILKVAAENKNKADFIILVPETMTKTN